MKMMRYPFVALIMVCFVGAAVVTSVQPAEANWESSTTGPSFRVLRKCSSGPTHKSLLGPGH